MFFFPVLLVFILVVDFFISEAQANKFALNKS